MSNPAPTLNQINAFNATQGTTIDFNIIGGTEVIRSNKIYIYDLSDNSLICTHLYVSTESIHELPSNTSSSIVYASGKSSADFTNNTQYYAQIQTFTDVGGTQGGSGLSIAKLFWCLPTPTLTLSTIPTTISTTSYNVSATYTPNTSGGATNEIQEFQFNLYSAIGALLQTSGVVLYGDGVDLSYNFSGLEVDSTYYVTLDVTTTQGMNVSAQSNTFTVSIDTPTMGSASVVNNGCDGYISVTSNLSSEYEHEESAEAGEIMNFTTDSVNDITELDVDFSPVQDGTPWMSAQDTTPYMFRAVPTQTEDFGHESDTIVGGTVGWNQLYNKTGNSTSNGITYTNTNGKITLSGEASANSWYTLDTSALPQNHKYLVCGGNSNSVYQSNAWLYFIPTVGTYIHLVGGKTASIQQGCLSISIQAYTGYNANTNPLEFVPQIVDLTAYFGSTIADYVYTLEQGTAGAGVAWLRANEPQLFEYHAYDAGSLVSVSGLTSHDMVGFNQWDEEWEVGTISETTGANIADTTRIRSKNLIPVVGGQTYYVVGARIAWYEYDANGNFLRLANNGSFIGPDEAFTVSSDAGYIRFKTASAYGTTYNNDICINLSDASLNGTYKSYVKHSYPLDSTLTLRGIPKLANGKLKYDGDIYHADGSVDRRYGIVDLGSLNWTDVGVSGKHVYLASVSGKGAGRDTMVCSKYPLALAGYDEMVDKTITGRNGAPVDHIYIRDESYTTASALKTSLDGVKLVFNLATPTTETADPYTNPQIVDPSGTEEYVGSSIPVGHNTTYQRICPITGWTGCEVVQTSRNLFNGSYDVMYKLPEPIPKGTWVTASAKTSGNTQIYYYDENQAQIDYFTLNQTDPNDSSRRYRTFQMSKYESQAVPYYIKFTSVSATDMQFELSSEDAPPTAYEAPTLYNITWQTEAGTVYGGTLDVVSGVLTVHRKLIDLGTLTYSIADSGHYGLSNALSDAKTPQASTELANILCSNYMADTQQHVYYKETNGTIALATNGTVRIYDTSITASSGTEFATKVSGVQLVYELATPQTYQLTPQQMQTLSGQNNVWSNTNGGMYLVYQLPITSLLVKRRDVADISGKWLTLYSTPITQASDMDFTFIDFLNQYGKTYQYALVPVLAQNQSGVIVQIEGGYTVSDNVDSIFDGVYIADQTNVERVKAGVGYGNIDMNQGVGSITPIGSKYPIVITNSQNQYHNGSVRGTIVPNDFYSNGNLSRIDMVNKRDELEQFLTNKRAKIIKDWNGKMWLVMIMSNVACSFDDNYGMGMVSFSADWLEVGDPTNQQDLYNAGLINVGGV